MNNGIFLVAGLLLGGIAGGVQIGDNVDISNFKHLSYFVKHMDEVNEARVEEGYSPTSIDYIKSVPINTVDGNKLDGRLLKFKEGYILFGEDDVIHSISHIDDVPLNKNGKLEFYDIGGFVEYNKESDKYEALYTKYKSSASINSDEPVIYDGQMNSGDGTIFEPESYVLSKYGEGYSCTDSYKIKSLADPDKLTAIYVSCVDVGQYKTNLGANYLIDEDCYGLITANIVCDFIARTYEMKFSRIRAFKYDCATNEPELYEYKTTHGWWLTENRVSKLYMILRKYMYDTYGKLEFLTRDQVVQTVQWFAEQYNYPLSLVSTLLFRDMCCMTDYFTEALKKDQIMIVDISNSPTYGELVGCAAGFQLWQNIKYFLGAEIIKQVYLLEYRDTFTLYNWLDITFPGTGCKTVTMVTSPDSFNPA